MCEFLPKYYPELSAVERCWATAKKYMRGCCRFNFKDMLKKVLKALVDPEIQAISMIWKVFRKEQDYMRAYKSGLNSYKDVKIILKQYKSHGKPPDSEATEKKYKPYEKKREIQINKLKDLKKFSESFRLLNNQTALQSQALEYSVVANDFSTLLNNFSSAYDSDVEALKFFNEGYDADLP